MHPYGMQDGQSLNAGFVQAEVTCLPRLRHAEPDLSQSPIEWQGWVDAAKVAESHGMELDTNFYTWGPAVMYPNGNRRTATSPAAVCR